MGLDYRPWAERLLRARIPVGREARIDRIEHRGFRKACPWEYEAVVFWTNRETGTRYREEAVIDRHDDHVATDGGWRL